MRPEVSVTVPGSAARWGSTSERQKRWVNDVWKCFHVHVQCASIILYSPPLARQVTWLLRPTSCQCFTLWKEKCYLQTPQSPPHHHYYCLPKHQTWTCTPWDCSVCLLCEVTLYNILILLRIETGTLNLWMATAWLQLLLQWKKSFTFCENELFISHELI